MSDYKVVVTDDRYGAYREESAVLDDIGAELKVCHFNNPAEALKELEDADGVFCNLFPMTEEIMAGMKKCRVISRYGVGYDNVDTAAAERRGIAVTNVPDYCSEDVADHILALLLGAIRHIPQKDRRIRNGEWNLHKHYPCSRISGKTLGLIGYGHVGQKLHLRTAGFGFGRVLVHDPTEDPAFIEAKGGVKTGLEELLRESDYVSVSVPLKPETKGLLNRQTLGLMKPSAVLINTARGPVVDEEALCQALREGRPAAAGLDVFETEPLPDDSPLRQLDNVILSDHAGWYSAEALASLKTQAARNIALVLTGKPPISMVNSPI